MFPSVFFRNLLPPVKRIFLNRKLYKLQVLWLLAEKNPSCWRKEYKVIRFIKGLERRSKLPCSSSSFRSSLLWWSKCKFLQHEYEYFNVHISCTCQGSFCTCVFTFKNWAVFSGCKTTDAANFRVPTTARLLLSQLWSVFQIYQGRVYFWTSSVA